MLSSIIPTTAAFYLAFASVSLDPLWRRDRVPAPYHELTRALYQSRILLIGLQTLLAAAIGVLNTFPLFVLLVRLKSPHRLPGKLSPWTLQACVA